MGKILRAIKDKGRIAGITIATALAMMYNVNTANSQYLKVLNLKDNLPVAGVRDSVVLYDNGVPILKAVKESDANGIAEFTDTDWKSTSVKTIDNNIPSEISVSNSWPNVISSYQETNTNVSSPRRAKITQKLYNILGQEIINYTLENDGNIEPSTVSISAKIPSLATAMYFLRTTIKTDKEEKVQTNRIIIHNDGSTMTYSGNTTMAANMRELVAYTPTTQNTEQAQVARKTTGNLEARIFSQGSHYYLPTDSTSTTIMGGNTQTTISGQTGIDVKIKMYDFIQANTDTTKELIPNTTLKVDNKTRMTNDGGEATITLLPDQFLPVSMTHPDFRPGIIYTETGKKDTTIKMGLVRRNPAEGKIFVDDRSWKYIDTNGFWPKQGWGGFTWDPIFNENKENILPMYFTILDSTGWHKFDTTDTYQKAFRDSVIYFANMKNNVSKSVLNPTAYFNKTKSFYPETNPLIDTTKGGTFYIDYSQPIPYPIANTGANFDTTKSVVTGFQVMMNAKQPITNFVVMNKELNFNFFNEIPLIDGTWFDGIYNVNEIYASMWDQVKYFQLPVDQALQRMAATNYLGKRILNGETLVMGYKGTIEKPRN